MPNQKFKITVFIPRLTDITSMVEIEVNPNFDKIDIEKKLIEKLNIQKNTSGILLSKKSPQPTLNLAKLIDLQFAGK